MTSPKLLQIPAGEDLLPTLTTLEPGAFVQGNGHVEGVALKLPGEATDVTRQLQGRFVLVSLLGPAGGPFTVTLARASDVGLEMVGGTLARARSQGVSLAVFTPAAVAPTPRREVLAVAPATAPAASPASAPAQAAPAAPARAPSSPDEPAPPPRSWADVAAASEAAEQDDEGALPERGDLVDHFSFGLCEVIKAEGERLHLRDVKGPGRIREVVVTALKVSPPTPRNGKRCFRLMRKGT